MSNLNQAILEGAVDSYCLVCEIHFRNDELLYNHKLDSTHLSNLQKCGYVEKYQTEGIRKVKNGYLCDFCNELIATTAKVAIHIDNPQHIYTKGASFLKREDGEVIAFDQIYIDDDAWNGIVEDTCVLCNIEFDDVDLHIGETKHSLNLIQRKTEIGTWGVIYRMIDSNSFHCLPCNKALLMTVFATHFSTEEHKQNCMDSIPTSANFSSLNVVNDMSIQDILDKASETPFTIKKCRSLNSCLGFRDLYPNSTLDFATEALVPALLKAGSYIITNDHGDTYCIVCVKTIDGKNISSHIEDPNHKHSLKVYNMQEGTREAMEQLEMDKEIMEEVAEYRKNNIELDFALGTAKCTLCHKEFDVTDYVIDEHIEYHNKLEKAAQQDSQKERDGKQAKLAQEGDKEVVAKNGAAQASRGVEAPRVTPKAATTLRQRNWTKSSAIPDAEKLHWATEHNITFSNNQNMAHCSICNSTLPINVKNFTEHVAGNSHKNNLAKRLSKEASIAKSKAKPVKVQLKHFIKSFLLAESFGYQFFIINNKFMVGYKSMSFLERSAPGRLTCFLCKDEIEDTQEMIDAHRTIIKHVEALTKAAVIQSLDTEFIRELASGEFHCGFCNCVAKDWDDLHNQHLNTIDHRENKLAAEWRLLELN